MQIHKRSLWEVQPPVDYNLSTIQQAIRNKEIAVERKDYNEVLKWDKVIKLLKKKGDIDE